MCIYIYTYGSSPTYSGPGSMAPRRTARPRMWTIPTAGAFEPLSPDFPTPHSKLIPPTHLQRFCHFHHRVCRKNIYDGVEEYHVMIREKGSREAEETHEEKRTSSTKLEAHCVENLVWSPWVAHDKQIGNIESALNGWIIFASNPSLCAHTAGPSFQAPQAPSIPASAFDNLDKMKERMAIEDSAPSQKPKPPTQEEEASCVNWLGYIYMAIFLYISLGRETKTKTLHVPVWPS